MTDAKAAPATGDSKRQIKLERVYPATLEEVWALWTTPEGFESWWGPEGFVVEVRKLDLRPGGELHYAMIAKGEPQIAFMKRAGMPLSTETRMFFTQIEAPRRLAYENLADFIPGVKPYRTATAVDLIPEGKSVRMVITIDPMHDETWTERARMGWESQLTKLARVLGAE